MIFLFRWNLGDGSADRLTYAPFIEHTYRKCSNDSSYDITVQASNRLSNSSAAEKLFLNYKYTIIPIEIVTGTGNQTVEKHLQCKISIFITFRC